MGHLMILKVKWKLLNIDVIFENPEIQKSKMENPEIQKSKKENPEILRQIAKDKFNLTAASVHLRRVWGVRAHGT